MLDQMLSAWTLQLRVTAAAVLMFLGSGAARADANAYTDDKSVSVPTGWHAYQSLTTVQIMSLLNANQARLTSIDATNSTRFSVTMVANTGVYAAGWRWNVGLTADQVGAMLAESNGRLIDIEPYKTPDGIRFAAIMVTNVGDTARSWSWLVGVSAQQVSAHLQSSGHRLISLKSYAEDGVNKLVVIAVANTGADRKAWQYGLNLTLDQVRTRLATFNGRAVSLNRRGNGNFDLVQVRNTGADSHYARHFQVSTTQGGLAAAIDWAKQYGSRIVGIDSHIEPATGSAPGERVYTALMIDNANAEERRMRTVFGSDLAVSWDDPREVRPNGHWGAYLRPVGSAAAPTIPTVSVNGTRRFEPNYAITAVHNLAVMRRIRGLTLSPTTPLNFYQYPNDTRDDPNGPFPLGLTPGACPHPINETSANAVASTVEVIRDFMVKGDNRLVRAIVLLFGSHSDTTARGVQGVAALERIAIDTVGMMDTFIDQPLIGCGYAGNRRNLSTLADLGKLYEGVENGALLGTGTFRSEFFRPMAGDTFSSSHPSGLHEPERSIARVVREEGAALGKSEAVINDFLERMRWRYQGGESRTDCEDNPFTTCAFDGPGLQTIGYTVNTSFVGIITLPRRLGRSIGERDYVFGVYVNGYTLCSPFFSSDCGTEERVRTTTRRAEEELFRTVIRQNLSDY